MTHQTKVARALEDYLQRLEIRHICCSLYRAQTNGKRERFREMLQVWLNRLAFTSPEALRAALTELSEF